MLFSWELLADLHRVGHLKDVVSRELAEQDLNSSKLGQEGHGRAAARLECGCHISLEASVMVVVVGQRHNDKRMLEGHMTQNRNMQLVSQAQSSKNKAKCKEV